MIHKESDFDLVSKVPAITLGFWIIKILATTLGETGGDTVSISWFGETTPDAAQASLNGYLVGTVIFGTALVGFVWLQMRAPRFNPWLYWATIIASTTCGTTLADFADRSLGIGYAGGSLLLMPCVLASLFAWHTILGTLDAGRIATRSAEAFYWLTITFSQTLGTTLGDWAADDMSDGGWGLGYSGAALVFGTVLALLAILYFSVKVNRMLVFWTAFILTRPLGAAIGDFLDKPLGNGGLSLNRPIASLMLAIAIFLLIILLPQRPAGHPRQSEAIA